MNVTRLLKLYKQHYLKSYHEMAKAEYSCWGYFDCMEVDLVKNRNRRGLLMNNKNIDMAALWYASAGATEKLTGHYGQQSIGLFRCEPVGESGVTDEEFWREENKGIILIACMMQMADPEKIRESMVQIEQMVSAREDGNIQGITYRTFDNFDLILFLKGNCYVKMSELVDCVGKRQDIVYKYSVCGVAQNYLDCVKQRSEIEKIEYNGKRLDNDEIAEVWLEIVSNGKVNLRDITMDFKDGTEYAKVLGYVNNMICIQNTNMHDIVWMFRAGEGGITHENKEYGNGIYNISTVVLPEWEKIEISDGMVSTSGQKEINGWCTKKITDLGRYQEKLDDSRNEVLYSNWLALIRVLNVLSQYENSMFSKDIFRIIFPSIRVICYEFEDILKNYDVENFMKQGYDRVLVIEKYISEVDGIIQHLIHTSQTFLTVPGYSGSLYDIPTKMLLFYMSYAHKMMENFDDSDTKFSCFICPLLNSKPEVQEIEMREENEILLDIRLAQRHMYMPRAFIVILTHEIFHYIGKGSRLRRERATHLIKMCVYTLAHILLWGKESSVTDDEGIKLPIKEKERELQDFLIKTIPDAFNERNRDGDEKAYGSAMLLKLMADSCCAALYDSKYGLDEVLRRIQMQDWQGMEDIKEAFSRWAKFLDGVEKNLERELTKDTIEEIVDRFIYSFQEIYADISSIICLDLELKYYFEAILVSEGMMLGENFKSILVINRIAVVVHSLSRKEGSWKGQWKELVNDADSPLKGLIDQIEEYIVQMTPKKELQSKKEKEEKGQNEKKMNEGVHEWPYFHLDGVWHEQVKYAEKCIDELQKHFSDNSEKRECINEIQNVFNLFKMYGDNSDKSYDELFENYDRLTAEYNETVDQMIQKANSVI